MKLTHMKNGLDICIPGLWNAKISLNFLHINYKMYCYFRVDHRCNRTRHDQYSKARWIQSISHISPDKKVDFNKMHHTDRKLLTSFVVTYVTQRMTRDIITNLCHICGFFGSHTFLSISLLHIKNIQIAQPLQVHCESGFPCVHVLQVLWALHSCFC